MLLLRRTLENVENAEQGYIRVEKQVNTCISKHIEFNVETTISITVVI